MGKNAIGKKKQYWKETQTGQLCAPSRGTYGSVSPSNGEENTKTHMKYKYIAHEVPAEVYQHLRQAIATNDMECADNFRFTPVDDPQGLMEYDEIALTGCCGSWEGGVTDAAGRQWKVGCNYGH